MILRTLFHMAVALALGAHAALAGAQSTAQVALPLAWGLFAASAAVLVLLALSESGSPSYDHALASELVGLGAYCFTCTPRKLVGVMARIMKHQDPGPVIRDGEEAGW